MKFVCNTVVVPCSCFMLFEMSLQNGCRTPILNTSDISSLFTLCLAVGQNKQQLHHPLSSQL